MEGKTLKKGLFISFEGPEGSGKSTQIKLLNEYLKKKGYNVVLTREPGGTKISENIRNVLLSPENKEILPETELFLYAAARIQHIGEIIKPALNKGSIVISDRFHDSTTAYQGYGRNISLDYIEKIHKLSLKDTIPDITFVLMVDVRLGIKRARNKSEKGKKQFKGGDRIEQENIEFHKQVIKGYYEIAEKEKDRITIIPENTIKNVHKKIIKIIEKKLGELCE